MDETTKTIEGFTPSAPSQPIRLLDDAQASLERFVEATGRWIDPSDYTIGGGTALEARWHHRHSTDVDLFGDKDAIAEAVTHERKALRAALLGLTNTTRERFHIGRDFVAVELREAPITLIADRRLTTNPIADEHVERTAVRAQSSEEILAKKIHLRIIEARTFHARDLYDMLWARERAPYAWYAAIADVTEAQWTNIRRALEPMANDWGANDQTLANAADQTMAANLKERSIALVTDAVIAARMTVREG